MPTIDDLLARKGTEVASVAPGATVTEAVKILNERRIGSLVVVGPDGEVVGIATERDVLRLVHERPGDLGSARIGDIMTRDLICCVPEDDLDYAMSVMTENRVRHLPVLSGGRLAGIISIGDVVRGLKSEREYEVRQLRDYISGTYA